MPEKAAIAIVGTGWWATTAHLPAMTAHDRIGKIILVDHKPEAARAAAAKYGIPLAHCFTSAAEAKAAHPDLQGAIVATTHHAHYAAAKDCLDQGMHLLLEKPMTIYARDAKALVDQSAAANLTILMGYTFPCLPPVMQAKRYIDEGLIGDIEYVACSMSSVTYDLLLGHPERFEPASGFAVTGPTPQTYSEPTVSGGGQGVLQITHLAAMMFHLSPGMRAEVVTAFMNNLHAKVDVIDAMAVRMNTGALATVGSSGNLRPGDPGSVEVHLHGSKGRIMVDGFTGEFFMHLHDGRQEHIPRHHPAYPGDVPVSKFVEILLDGAEPLFPGAVDGLYTVELLEAAARSAAQDGQRVFVRDLYN
ncbi:MAG: Gfo/Idh/MocA family oxidoreductase [Anaerolineae bacterium]|nr:Gfo/Idh/MocA family oxidoreductase [Anaerolineae bacterium]NUQ04558.1 Gfo/Idh/MocA family oxidoreductase [Anaerolineae bacterium]